MKLYIAVAEDFPDHMVPVLVAHTVLNADNQFKNKTSYRLWKTHHFKKVVVKVSRPAFEKILALDYVAVGGESSVMNGEVSCAIVLPYYSDSDVPNVLRQARLWKPGGRSSAVQSKPT